MFEAALSVQYYKVPLFLCLQYFCENIIKELVGQDSKDQWQKEWHFQNVGVILSREVASAPGKAGVKGKFSTALERCRLFHKNNELFSNRGLLKECFMILL